MVAENDTGEVEAEHFSFREDVRYFEGTVREDTVLRKGDRIQLWTNDRRRTGTNPKTGQPYNDGVLNVKVLSAGAEKGKDLSRMLTGLWARFKRN